MVQDKIKTFFLKLHLKLSLQQMKGTHCVDHKRHACIILCFYLFSYTYIYCCHTDKCISLPNRLSLEFFKLTKHQSFQQHEILGIFLFEDGLLRKMKAFNNLCFKREQFLLTFILLIFY